MAAAQSSRAAASSPAIPPSVRSSPRPLEALAPDPKAVPKGAAVAHEHIDEALGGMDHESARRFVGAEENHLPREGAVRDRRFLARNATGLVANIHGLHGRSSRS